MKKLIYLILAVLALHYTDCESTHEDGSKKSGSYTSGNTIYMPDGKPFRGRGANIYDTRSCLACAWQEPDVEEVKRRIDTLVDGWKANFIRLDLESYASAESGQIQWKSLLNDEDYLNDIVNIVDYIGTKPGVYVMVSLWVDPSFDENGWPTTSTNLTWAKLAGRLLDRSYVMFGIANEPMYNFDGADDDDVWTRMNNAVQAIRDVQDDSGVPYNVIVVQGTGGWARRIGYYVTNPITAGGGTNIAYEVHVYDAASEFEEMFETPAKTIPVIIGEFGPSEGSMTLEDCSELMERAEAAGIPYLAWAFHMRCPPNLLVDNSGGGCGCNMTLAPTEWGTLLMNRLATQW